MRFLLANERTLLAWVCTSIALEAGGLALLQFTEGTSHKLAVYAVIIGALTSVIGYIRYRAADKAIRSGQLPKPGHGPAFEVASVTAIALVILLYYL